jgi:hypothetical protein
MRGPATPDRTREGVNGKMTMLRSPSARAFATNARFSLSRSSEDHLEVSWADFRFIRGPAGAVTGRALLN